MHTFFSSFFIKGLVNLTHDNQTGKDNDVTWNLEVVSSKFFLHFWMGSIFIFILWPPALFRTNQKWSTKKASSSRCCYSVTRGIEETPGQHSNVYCWEMYQTDDWHFGFRVEIYLLRYRVHAFFVVLRTNFWNLSHASHKFS